MKICVIGTGYVGLVAGACFAEMGNDVICVDNDLKKIEKLEKGIIPIYEPGLDDLVLNNFKNKKLIFTNSTKDAVEKSQVIFIAVGTPQGEDGSADLKYVEQVAKDIGKNINEYKVIVDKSTVPVGTAEKVKNIIANLTDKEFDVVSNPEFLKQGMAVKDFLNPDRVVIGSDTQKSTSIMLDLYKSISNNIITMDTKSAELVKYASNSFLAVKISYANEIANLCEKLGADMNKVRVGMCADKRIGSEFLFPGLGYGGSCFPKDVKAISKIAKDNGVECAIIDAADKINKKQRLKFVDKIFKIFGNDLTGKTFAVWGLAFKPETNDMREAPSITIINLLVEHGAKIKTYDPQAFEIAKTIFENKIMYSENAMDAVTDADALLLITEWKEFKNPNFDEIKRKLRTPIIFDGRNIYNRKELENKGFQYLQVGKKD
ncbi:MAG: UDP-glucose/GDP-mannose dehydrogenase family protein [Rickettsiales bacterium]|jgi:UDPglucose 6-dehydrogenase|nr:UDP-glucose/GDP-mannose dehydrogenase family protein [Rickettsiales bacterium]